MTLSSRRRRNARWQVLRSVCRAMSVCWWPASTIPCSRRPGSGWQALSPSCVPTISRSPRSRWSSYSSWRAWDASPSMRGGGDPREVVDALASTTQEASDYLANEVLNQLPPNLARFLMHICVLDEFDVQLCEAVSGQDDAGRLLDRVVADDLFIYQVDRAGE